jgi:cold shock CspA family protein
MQGTVFTFDEQTQNGSVVLDSGRRIDFDSAAFASSGLRLLRPGQRVRFEVEGDRILALTILTLPPPSN